MDTTQKEILLFELEGANEYHPTYVKKADDLIVRVIPIFHNCKVDMRGYDNVVVEFHERTDKLPQELYTVERAERLLWIESKNLQAGETYNFRVYCKFDCIGTCPKNPDHKDFTIIVESSPLVPVVYPKIQIINRTQENFTIFGFNSYDRKFII